MGGAFSGMDGTGGCWDDEIDRECQWIKTPKIPDVKRTSQLNLRNWRPINIWVCLKMLGIFPIIAI